MAAHGDTLDLDVLVGLDVLHRNIQEALRMNPPLIMVMRLAKEAFSVTTSEGKSYVVPKVRGPRADAGDGGGNGAMGRVGRGCLWGREQGRDVHGCNYSGCNCTSVPGRRLCPASCAGLLVPPLHPPRPTFPSLLLQGHIVAASPTFSHTLPHVFKEPMQYQPDRFAAPREEDKAMNLSYLGFGGGRHACMVREGSTACEGGGWWWLWCRAATHGADRLPSYHCQAGSAPPPSSLTPPLAPPRPAPPPAVPSRAACRASSLRICRSRRSGA